ncbi:MAG: formate dehydrogenase accessory sulfurtransferase FdhD [Gammaproteobacteria bacterium]|nr:formate dehydrogenase accessory sulfurtransferase FdhD [Gammaproteobacteria bacterium]
MTRPTSDAAIEAARAPAASLRIDVEAVAGDDHRRTGSDVVTIEEPLEIRLSYGAATDRHEQSISITMRTPGNDEELAVGFLAGEGIVTRSDDVRLVEHCGPPSPDKGIRNVVRVELADDVAVDPGGLLRHFYTTSSCGVCGKASLDAVRIHVARRRPRAFSIHAAALRQLPGALRARQTEFARTGGLHATASFDRAGAILRVREDIGRHNAFDKLAGSYLAEGGLAEHGILLSGRASFELLQKAAVAGTALVASIGPPSSLAVELALDQGITLAGFLKPDRFNIYTRPDRISL